MGKTVKLDSEHELVVLDDGAIKIDRQPHDFTIALNKEGAEKLAQEISVEPWFRVEERLPDDEITVQVYCEQGDEYFIAWREDGRWWSDGYDTPLKFVSHWRDLVAPKKDVVER